ncbi:RagB/SusD family nutrient uptake outer membrane protein [Flavobacterium sp. TMP13]|uniref:RagB/SusD family nutrient uptake outer membrane protein n=1 Tax=Flavobacterium sp. TMP13 TaxID=3425950 RepID=UPI003D775069
MLSCDSFIQVDLPVSQLPAQSVFNDKATATAAMIDIYAKIRNKGLFTGNPSGLSNQLGLYADELTAFGGELNFYNNSILSSDYQVAELWNSSYNQIYAANSVLEGVNKSTALTELDKKELKGEALFVRALVHFHLLNIFGDIPYILTTDYKQNRLVKRMSENEIRNHINADLIDAKSLLPEKYLTSDRTRPNKWTVQAFLARVHLYAEEWDKAEQAASTVINQTALYQPEDDLNNIFLKDATTTIWQLMPELQGGNTIEATVFSFIKGPPPASAINPALHAAFSSNDLRKMYWLTAVTKGAEVWYHASKYKATKNTGISKEYSIMFRLAEQYLIRAEARAHQGNLIGAKEDLNRIRHTAGLADTSAYTASEIIKAVWMERKLEFFTEYGHRFFDLKRTGMLDPVLTTLKTGWNSTDRLFPIPESELLLNDNLSPQNAGY